MKIALRNKALLPLLLKIAMLGSLCNFSKMPEKAFSFTLMEEVEIVSPTQLQELIAERRARGMSPEQLRDFERWHSAALMRWLASEQQP